ncbi:MAG: TIM barrel protein [Micromonosporaceae bacterium]
MSTVPGHGTYDAPVSRPRVLDRLAAAPISWGVCEVPGWGHQLSSGRVFREMNELGITATEFGPEGFLPEDPDLRAMALAGYRLRPVGGFVPAVLHDPGYDPTGYVGAMTAGFVAAGANRMVLAAATGQDGYDTRPVLDEVGWRTLLGNLDRIAQRAAQSHFTITLHPHIGTMVENFDEVHRVLEGSGIPLCLDTGHLLIGGTDPVELTRQAPDRIAHVHLKDVDAALAAQVRAGEITYTEAVRQGVYRPLGQGDIDIAGIITTLEANGYSGWYVLEQDTILTAAPGSDGPAADVRVSIDYLRALDV